MRFVERKNKSEYLLEMIKKGRCLSLIQIAEKFNISKRTVKRMIAELKSEGHNINYCKCSKKFLIK